MKNLNLLSQSPHRLNLKQEQCLQQRNTQLSMSVLLVNRTAVLSVSVPYAEQNCSIVNISSLYLTLFQCGFCFRFILVLSFDLHLQFLGCPLMSTYSSWVVLRCPLTVLGLSFNVHLQFLGCPSISTYSSWAVSFHEIFCVTICNVFFLFRACGFTYLLYPF